MATTPDPTADKAADSSTPSPSPAPSPSPSKDSSPAQPEAVAPEGEEGVKVGGLNYTTNVDGTRTYPDQKPVKTEDDPTPQPESDAQAAPDAPKSTDAPAGS